MENLELYIHIPFCERKCNYCDFLSAPASEEIRDQYTGALVNEIKSLKALYGQVPVSTVYIGGGTPSVLSENNIEKIITALRENFDLSGLEKKNLGIPESKKDKKRRGLAASLASKIISRKNRLSSVEFSIECNPGTLTKEKLDLYKKLGINRLSLGLQSAIDEELKVLGRIHTVRDFLNSYDLARDAGFNNINVDLMQAVPCQTISSWKKSLLMVAALRPEHISAYSLIIEEGTPFEERFKSDPGFAKLIPDEDSEREIYHSTKDILAQAGYERYEISNYALTGYECRHNLGYWERKDYLGLGLGSSSLIDNTRWKNISDLNKYMDFWKEEHSGGLEQVCCETEKLSRKDQMEEFMFLGLRKTEGITKEDFFQTFGESFDHVYGDVALHLEADGLIEITEIARESNAEDVSNFRKKEPWAKGIRKITSLEEIYGTKYETRVKLTERGVDISNHVLAEFLQGNSGEK